MDSILKSTHLPRPQNEVGVVAGLHPHELHHGVDEGGRRVAEVRAELPDRPRGRREGRGRRGSRKPGEAGGGVPAAGGRAPAD